MAVDIQDLREKNPLKAYAEAVDGGWKDTIDRAIEVSTQKDHLTQVLDRKGFTKALEMEMVRAKRLNKPLSLIFVEPDNFKNVNDKHGHDRGDKVLVETAQILEKSVRRNFDYVARWGGDEFVIILPNADIDEAPIKANEVRENISKNFQELGLTASLGVAQFKNGQTAEELVKAADQAMYFVKHNGKDAVGVELENGQIVDFAKAKATAA